MKKILTVILAVLITVVSSNAQFRMSGGVADSSIVGGKLSGAVWDSIRVGYLGGGSGTVVKLDTSRIGASVLGVSSTFIFQEGTGIVFAFKDAANDTVQISALIDSSELLQSSIAGWHIRSNTIDSTKLANNSVTTNEIKDATVLFADIAPNGAGSGQVIEWNGSAWVAITPTFAAPGIKVDSGNGTPTRMDSIVIKAGVGAIVSFSSIVGGFDTITFKTTLGTSIDSSEVAAGLAALRNGSVDSNKIINSSVGNGDIAPAVLTFDKWAANGAAAGQVPKWNGAAWVAANDSGGVSSSGTAMEWDTSGTGAGVQASAAGAVLKKGAGIFLTFNNQSTDTITVATTLGASVDLTSEVTGVLPDANVANDITAANYLPLAGGTLTGNVQFNENLYMQDNTDSIVLPDGGVIGVQGGVLVKFNNTNGRLVLTGSKLSIGEDATHGALYVRYTDNNVLNAAYTGGDSGITLWNTSNNTSSGTAIKFFDGDTNTVHGMIAYKRMASDTGQFEFYTQRGSGSYLIPLYLTSDGELHKFAAAADSIYPTIRKVKQLIDDSTAAYLALAVFNDSMLNHVKIDTAGNNTNVASKKTWFAREGTGITLTQLGDTTTIATTLGTSIDSSEMAAGLAGHRNNTIDSTKIVDGSISGGDLKAGIVDSTKAVATALALLRNNSVDSNKILNGTVIAADLKAGIIDSTKATATALALLRNNSVDSNKIVDGTIIDADVKNGTLTFAKWAQNGAASGQIPKWNGASWAAANDNSGAGGAGDNLKVDSSGTGNNVIDVDSTVLRSGFRMKLNVKSVTGYDTVTVDFLNKSDTLGSKIYATSNGDTVQSTGTKIVLKDSITVSGVFQTGGADGSGYIGTDSIVIDSVLSLKGDVLKDITGQFMTIYSNSLSVDTSLLKAKVDTSTGSVAEMSMPWPLHLAQGANVNLYRLGDTVYVAASAGGGGAGNATTFLDTTINKDTNVLIGSIDTILDIKRTAEKTTITSRNNDTLVVKGTVATYVGSPNWISLDSGIIRLVDTIRDFTGYALKDNSFVLDVDTTILQAMVDTSATGSVSEVRMHWPFHIAEGANVNLYKTGDTLYVAASAGGGGGGGNPMKIDSGAVVSVDSILFKEGTTTNVTVTTTSGWDTAKWEVKLASLDSTYSVATALAALKNNSVDSNKIVNGSVIGADLKADLIDSTKIKDGTVIAADLKADLIDSTKIKDGTVIAADLKAGIIDSTKASATALALLRNNSVDSNKIVNGSVSAADIKTGIFDSTYFIGTALAELKNNSVDSNKIVDGSVSAGDLKAGIIDSTKASATALALLRNNSVDSNKIVNGSVSLADIKAGALDSTAMSGTTPASTVRGNSIDSLKIIDGSISGGDLKAGIIDSTKTSATALALLRNNSVDSNKIVDGTIIAADIKAGILDSLKTSATALALLRNNSVDSNKIVNGSIIAADLKQGIIDSTEVVSTALALLRNNSVDSNKIVDGTVIAADLKASIIDSSKIVDGSISGSDLKAGIIDSLKTSATALALLRNNSVDSNKIVDGTIIAADIKAGILDSLKTSATALALLRNNSVDSNKIIDGTVSKADLKASIVDSSKIADGSVIGADLKADLIDSTKILDGTVIAADLKAGIIDSTKAVATALALLRNNSVDSNKIVDGTIIAADIKAGILDSLKTSATALALLRNNSVDSNKIVNASISGADLKLGIIDSTFAVATAKSLLRNNSVDSLKIVDLSISGGDLKAGIIDSTKASATALALLRNNSVDSNKIVNSSVSVADLVSGVQSFRPKSTADTEVLISASSDTSLIIKRGTEKVSIITRGTGGPDTLVIAGGVQTVVGNPGTALTDSIVVGSWAFKNNSAVADSAFVTMGYVKQVVAFPLDVVYRVAEASDLIGIFNGDTNILVSDSAAGTNDTDMVKLSGTAPTAMTLDTIVYVYQTAGGGSQKIDSVAIFARDGSDGLQIADSLISGVGTDKTATAVTRVVIAGGALALTQGDPVTVKFISVNPAANDRVRILRAYAKGKKT